MTFRLTHKIVTYLFAGLGLSALTLGSALSPMQLGVIGTAFVASWFVEEPLLSHRNYSRFWTAAAVVVLGVQIARVVSGAPMLGIGVEYAAFLQLSKLFYRKSATDHQQIAILGFLHLISGTVLSAALEYGIVFFGFVIVMPWMLALTHIRRELELLAGDEDRVLRSQLSKTTLATPAFFAGTTLLALPLFAVTAAFFFMFPRVGFGFFSGFGGRAEQIAGFGSDIQLGGFGTIRDDPSVVLRIKPAQMPDVPSAYMPIRLRGTSFDRFENGRWSRTKTYTVEVPRTGDEYPIFRSRTSSDWVYTIILDPLQEAVLFLPEGAVALKIPPRIESGRERYPPIYYSPGLDFRYRHRVDGQLIYQAFIDPVLDRYPERFTTAALERYLRVRGDYSRISALAGEVTDGLTEPEEIAKKIEAYLKSEGDFEYTLDQPNTAGRDPLEVFLFDAKAGHCEYFSSAMAMMLRTLSIPTRNVTGFIGADYNPYGGFYAVRNGNAHSWVEAFIGDQWVTFDPTPSSAIMPATGIMLKLHQVMDALRIRWAEYIVEYSVRDQTEALSKIASWYRRLRLASGSDQARPEEDASDGSSELFKNVDMRKIIVVLFPLLLLVAIVSFLFRRRRTKVAKRPLRPDQERAVRLYESLQHRLRDQGLPRAPDVTPQAHALRLRDEGFTAADDVDEITEAYLCARFGNGQLNNGEFQRLRSKARKI